MNYKLVIRDALISSYFYRKKISRILSEFTKPTHECSFECKMFCCICNAECV